MREEREKSLWGTEKIRKGTEEEEVEKKRRRGEGRVHGKGVEGKGPEGKSARGRDERMGGSSWERRRN